MGSANFRRSRSGLDRRARPTTRGQSSNTRVCGCQKPTVLTKCSMEWSVSIIQTAAALRTARTRRVTPTGPAHRASRSASPSDVMFAKACDLLWGREQGADQESEEVPTFTLADSSDDDEPEEPRAAPRRPRRKQSDSQRCTVLSRHVDRCVRGLPRLLRPGLCRSLPATNASMP